MSKNNKVVFEEISLEIPKVFYAKKTIKILAGNKTYQLVANELVDSDISPSFLQSLISSNLIECK